MAERSKAAVRLCATAISGVRIPFLPQKGTAGKIAEPELTTGGQLRVV